MTATDHYRGTQDRQTTDQPASYVYAVVPADARLPADLYGIDDHGVEIVPRDGIAAVVGPMLAGRALGKRRDLIAHMRVVDALAERGPTVPVRFGSVLSDAAAVADEFLAPNVEYFTSVLGYLAGRRQYIVRVHYDEETVLAEIVAENPGIAALRDRLRALPDDVGMGDRVRLGEAVSRALDTKRETDGQAVLDQLHPHVVASNVRPAAEADDMLRAVLLVEETDRATIEQVAEAVAEQLAGRARVQLVGPSAPFDFVPGG